MAWLTNKSFSLNDQERLDLENLQIPEEWRSGIRQGTASEIRGGVFQAKLASSCHSLPDLMSWGSFPVVSDAFRQIVERLEGSVHQFRPATLLNEHSQPVEKAYWGINIRQFCEAVIVEKSAVKVRPVAAGRINDLGMTRYLLTGAWPTGLVLSRRIISGRHLWRSREMNGYYFFSNELMELFVEGQLQPVHDFVQTLEE